MKAKTNIKKITHPFYGKAVWKKLSKNYKINNPLCKMCEERGIVRVGKYVDHIIPIQIDYELRLDVENLQCLCQKCHSHKTQKHDVQLLKGKEVLPLKGTDSTGMPTDKNHFWNKSNDNTTPKNEDIKEDEEEWIMEI